MEAHRRVDHTNTDEGRFEYLEGPSPSTCGGGRGGGRVKPARTSKQWTARILLHVQIFYITGNCKVGVLLPRAANQDGGGRGGHVLGALSRQRQK